MKTSNNSTPKMSLTLRDKLLRYPKAGIRSILIVITNCLCIPTYVVWMVLLLPLKRINPDTYYKVEGYFFHWLLAVVSSWSWSAGYDIVELGDDITQCTNHRTLVIANHQSTADVPLMMATFNTRPDILPNIMWIMDRLFKFTNFGIVSMIHQDFFIASGKSCREESVVLLKNHIIESYIPRQRHWMVLFPEGGFLRKRREVSQRFAQKNNLPVLNNVTLPRVGAMKAIVDVLGSTSLSNNNSSTKTTLNGDINRSPTNGKENGEKITSSFASTTVTNILNSTTPSNSLKSVTFDYILDITIAYPDARPLDLPNIVHGLRDPCQTYFFYRVYHSAEVPKESDSMTKWLYDRFVEKEEILNGYYKTGSFLYPSANTPTVVQQDLLRFIIIHLFFITSTYIHVQMFYTLYNYYSMYILSHLS